MKIIHDLENFNEPHPPAVLTIGNFDGMHRGHQAVISRVKNHLAESVVLTFENHPTTILRPENATQRLISLLHRTRLIEEQGIDTLLLFKFTKELSKKTAEEFLSLVKEKIPFTHLILGHDAHIGKDRQGTPEQLGKIANRLNFHLEYIPEYTFEGKSISSSMIREAVREGNLKEASIMLGRDYSIFSTVTRGNGKGKKIGFPTANIDLEGFCTPPFGVYAVRVHYKGKTLKGIANLGVAPTVKPIAAPQLEVHLFDFNEDIHGEEIEVVLGDYIRPEMKFPTIEALKAQIRKDIKYMSTGFKAGPSDLTA